MLVDGCCQLTILTDVTVPHGEVASLDERQARRLVELSLGVSARGASEKRARAPESDIKR